jgi:hypothetical protein
MWAKASGWARFGHAAWYSVEKAMGNKVFLLTLSLSKPQNCSVHQTNSTSGVCCGQNYSLLGSYGVQTKHPKINLASRSAVAWNRCNYFNIVASIIVGHKNIQIEQ